MEPVRCPECGSRLDSSYCPMCMKRVPVIIPGWQKKQEIPWQQRKYTVQHEEDHKCITFEEEKPARPVWTPPVKKQKPKGKGMAALVLTALFTVVVPIFSLIGEFIDDTAFYEEEAVRPEPVAYIPVVPGTGASVPGIDSQTIYDENGIKVTVDSAGLYYEDYALAYTVENATEQNITVTAEYIVVNGWMVDPISLFCQVEAGETVQAYLQLSTYDLNKRQISTVSDIELQLHIYDSEEYTDIGDSAAIFLHTEAEPQPKPMEVGGRLLLDRDGIRLIYQGYEYTEDGWCSFHFFLENKGETPVAVFDQGVFVNGQETEEYFWSELRPETCALYEMSVFDMEESLGVTDISQITDMTLELWLETADLKQIQVKLSFDPNGPLA